MFINPMHTRYSSVSGAWYKCCLCSCIILFHSLKKPVNMSEMQILILLYIHSLIQHWYNVLTFNSSSLWFVCHCYHYMLHTLPMVLNLHNQHHHKWINLGPGQCADQTLSVYSISGASTYSDAWLWMDLQHVQSSHLEPLYPGIWFHDSASIHCRTSLDWSVDGRSLRMFHW